MLYPPLDARGNRCRVGTLGLQLNHRTVRARPGNRFRIKVSVAEPRPLGSVKKPFSAPCRGQIPGSNMNAGAGADRIGTAWEDPPPLNVGACHKSALSSPAIA